MAPSAPQVYYPAPPPTTNAWIRPATAPQVNPRPVTAPAYVPNQSSDSEVVSQFIGRFDIDELLVFADKLRRTNGNKQARIQATVDHAKLIKAIVGFKA